MRDMLDPLRPSRTLMYSWDNTSGAMRANAPTTHDASVFWNDGSVKAVPCAVQPKGWPHTPSMVNVSVRFPTLHCPNATALNASIPGRNE